MKKLDSLDIKDASSFFPGMNEKLALRIKTLLSSIVDDQRSEYTVSGALIVSPSKIEEAKACIQALEESLSGTKRLED